MIRKSLLVVVWFPLAFVLILLNLTLLSATISSDKSAGNTSIVNLRSDDRLVTASHGTAQILGAQIIPGDARSLLLYSFLNKNESPMAPYADLIVQQADENRIDYRLVVAIAMCESNLGKKIPKKDQFNAWGIAVYTNDDAGKAFSDWPHAITWVTRHIRQHYYDRGITDLKNIGAIWAPPSVQNGYSWTNCVQNFMGSIL